MSEKSMLTIGKLAALTGVSADTLRYYEEEGLIAPDAKREGGYRLFGNDARRRIRFIKQAQQCGFSLADIRELLVLRHRADACCHDVRARAIEKKLQLEAKIRAMQIMSKALDGLISDCANEQLLVNECPILAALERAGDAPLTGSTP